MVLPEIEGISESFWLSCYFTRGYIIPSEEDLIGKVFHTLNDLKCHIFKILGHCLKHLLKKPCFKHIIQRSCFRHPRHQSLEYTSPMEVCTTTIPFQGRSRAHGPSSDTCHTTSPSSKQSIFKNSWVGGQLASK